jgi:hypothetical protein
MRDFMLYKKRKVKSFVTEGNKALKSWMNLKEETQKKLECAIQM